jgi:flavin-dependent dehydrogenase
VYDVLVIGAGPAGSTAAKTLAEKGYRVLLVEKFRIPRNKSCSGILIQKSMDFLQRHFGEAVPEAALCAPAVNRGMVFTGCDGKEYRFEQEGRNIWRSSFDGWLAGKAQESGARLQHPAMVLRLEERPEEVEAALRGERLYTERARYVLDCEGAAGRLGQKKGDGPLERITTFQTFNRGSIGLDPHYFYAYLQPELSEYDAWFNVKDGQLVLGVSGKDPRRLPGYYARFLAYMQRHGLQITETLRFERWLMPWIRPGCAVRCGEGRTLYAGEAAGFLNPMGEGISSAMESGYQAACAISGQFASPERVLEDYRNRVQPLRGYMLRQWSLVAGLAETFREMRIQENPR